MLSTWGSIVGQPRQAEDPGRNSSFIASMSDVLCSVLSKEGLTQYLETFRNEGFDCWHTVQDITETDLCV